MGITPLEKVSQDYCRNLWGVNKGKFGIEKILPPSISLIYSNYPSKWHTPQKHVFVVILNIDLKSIQTSYRVYFAPGGVNIIVDSSSNSHILMVNKFLRLDLSLLSLKRFQNLEGFLIVRHWNFFMDLGG